MSEDLIYRTDEAIATITLNRPGRKNAFTIQMIDDWADALNAAQLDDDVRAIVITGAGGDFCSGVDLDEFKSRTTSPLAQKQLLTDKVHRVARALDFVDKPVLAVVDGVAIGAGMDMALLCDLRFGSDRTRFSEGYIRVGLVPGDGGCWLLPRIVGTSKALRLLWTGEIVSGSEALAMGILDELSADPLDRALDFARQIAAQPPVAIRMIKRAVRQGARHDLQTALDLISSHLALVATTADSQEAAIAFRERRTPVYTGR